MGTDRHGNYHRIHAELLELIEMKRLLITLSDEAVMIWQAYQLKEKIRNKDDGHGKC